MIRMTYKRLADSGITHFSLSGHADFAEHGKDIVCSAVTAVTFGTVNAIETLLNTKLEVEMDEKGGFLRCTIPPSLDEGTHEKVQLLLESMLLTLQSIASEYGQYIKITQK